MTDVLLRSTDYVVDIESRWTNDSEARWRLYQRVTDIPTDKALERVKELNRVEDSRMEFRLTGTRIESVKELLT